MVAQFRMEGASVISADTYWQDEYGESCDEWSTKVELKLTDVPEHGDNKKKIDALVCSFCDAQTYRYDVEKREHYVVGFARSLESIPTHRNLVLKYETLNGVLLKSFSVKIVGRLCGEPSNNVFIEGEENLDEFIRTYEREFEAQYERDEAPEANEDPDVVREVFETQHMLNSTAYAIFRGDEDLDDLRRTYERQCRARRGQVMTDGEKSNSSGYGSLGMSIDSDWSFYFNGR